MSQTEAELDVGIGARLCVALEASTAAMERQRRDRDRLFADVSYFEAPAFTTAPAGLPYTPPADQYGPKDGFWWAIQRITVAGFGATTDFINLYKGGNALLNRALWTFQESVAGGVATWHPGRTGLMLNGRSKDTLTIGGTFTGAIVYVSSDVIQVTEAELPFFLL